MKLLTAIILGLSLIGGAASAANLSVNITIGGHSTAHVDHVCTIQHTNVSGALNGIIRWGFHTNGDLYIDDGHKHVFSKKMVKQTNSRIVVNHSNGNVVISKSQSWIKVSWYQNGVEKFVKGACK
jgi:uncharacterized membrane protein